jgi:hypothetical protein
MDPESSASDREADDRQVIIASRGLCRFKLSGRVAIFGFDPF